jgi:hypothetical protein
MGFFSWFTSDTNKSIANHYSVRSTFPVHMVTEYEQFFTENDYDGYGEFGGKDFYALAAELNGIKGKNDDETRNLFFDKIWTRGVRNGDIVLQHGKDFDNYETLLSVEGIDGLVTANALVSEFGWKHWDTASSGDTEEFVKAGFKMPKLVEQLPSHNQSWKDWWDSLPYPESCPHQGYFYDDDCDDDDDDDDNYDDFRTFNEAPYGQDDDN